MLTVRITVAGSSDWRYLMIEDPLPAGVEAIQDTTAYPMERAGRVALVVGLADVEYRDNRTVFFQESFETARYEFVYLVKAISSGEFRAVPAQVAPMYVPGRQRLVGAADGDGDARRRRRAVIRARSHRRGWLAVGARAASRRCHWAFLNTPESNVADAGAVGRCWSLHGRRRRRVARERRHAAGARRHRVAKRSVGARHVRLGWFVVAFAAAGARMVWRSASVDAWVARSLRRDQRVVHRAIRLGRHQPAASRRHYGSAAGCAGRCCRCCRVSLLAALLHRAARASRVAWLRRAWHWRTLAGRDAGVRAACSRCRGS